jgi:hypothetical protein
MSWKLGLIQYHVQRNMTTNPTRTRRVCIPFCHASHKYNVQTALAFVFLQVNRNDGNFKFTKSVRTFAPTFLFLAWLQPDTKNTCLVNTILMPRHTQEKLEKERREMNWSGMRTSAVVSGIVPFIIGLITLGQ